MKYPLIVKLRTALHQGVVHAVRLYYTKVWGAKIGKGCRISLGAKIDKTNPQGVTIGDYTAVTFNAVILTHDFVNRRHLPVTIGSHCFIGCGATILPGVTIGDHCIIGTNTLVMRDVPSNSLVMGNPGRVIERDIRTVRYGMRARPHEEDIPLPPQAQHQPAAAMSEQTGEA